MDGQTVLYENNAEEDQIDTEMHQICQKLEIEDIDSLGFPPSLQQTIQRCKAVFHSTARNRRHLNDVLKSEQQHHGMSTALNDSIHCVLQKQ